MAEELWRQANRGPLQWRDWTHGNLYCRQHPPGEAQDRGDGGRVSDSPSSPTAEARDGADCGKYSLCIIITMMGSLKF